MNFQKLIEGGGTFADCTEIEWQEYLEFCKNAKCRWCGKPSGEPGHMFPEGWWYNEIDCGCRIKETA